MKLTRPINLTLARPTKWRESLWIWSARLWKRSIVATSPSLKTEGSSPDVPDARLKDIAESTDSNPAQPHASAKDITRRINKNPRKASIPWTPDEIEIFLKASDSGQSARATAEQLPGRPFCSISETLRFCRKLGPSAFVLTSPRAWTPDEKATLARLRRAGVERTDMLSYFPGRSFTSVRNALSRIGGDGHVKRQRKYIRYTAAEDELLMGLATRDITNELMGRLLNRTVASIGSRLRFLGSAGLRRRWTPEKDEKLLQLFKDGVPRDKIALALDMPFDAVSKHLDRIRPPETVNYKPGRRPDGFSMTPEQVRDIEKLRDHGLTWAAIQAQNFPHFAVWTLSAMYRRQGGKVCSTRVRAQPMSSADADVVQRLRSEKMTWWDITKLRFPGKKQARVIEAFGIYVARCGREGIKEAQSSGSDGAS